ncbi:MAG TPA: ATP-binding protein, partial [Holophagaceae bacterium]|nr:ATP-binding protein [Holophagaceae bacterium]
EKFRAFAETLSCVILLFDDRIRYVNPFATRMLGWTPEELLGQPFWKIVHPEDQALVRERGEARLRGESVASRYEFRVLTKAGETRWVDFTASRASFGGHTYGLGTVFDVTDRVGAVEARLKMERRLLEAQKLESLGLLAGGVAHDFNNLLAAILGNAELASEMAPAGSPLRAPLGQIENACMRASDLTRQMLAYAGQGKFIIEPLELGKAVRGIAELMRASIPRLVEINLETAAGELWLEGDSAQVQQVILNLVTNAAEAIGQEAGRIEVRTGRRRVERKDAAGLRAAEDLKPGPMVYLEVSDTGQGMDATTLERIFEPFFTTKFQGRGLGLAAMQGIVRGHGGAIDVRSAPGKGTTFRIYFPELARG